jgi:peptidylprolyl isomerase
MTLRTLSAAVCLALSLAACSNQPASTDASHSTTEPATSPTPAASQGAQMDTFSMPANLQSSPSGLQYTIDQPGTGAQPQPGQTVSVHYTGYLTNGEKFDSSRDRGAPLEFPVGQGRVIKGWDEGIAAMRVGEKRTLVIPPALGYGARGAGRLIPPNATLVFKVELVGVR